MKKLAIVVSILLMAGGAFAVEVTPLNYRFSVLGTPVDNTFAATLDNTTVSLRTLAEAAGITWVQSGQSPNGALITVETKDARIGNAAIVSGSVGHVIAVGSSFHSSGAGFTNALYLTSSVATDNTGVVQITLER